MQSDSPLLPSPPLPSLPAFQGWRAGALRPTGTRCPQARAAVSRGQCPRPPVRHPRGQRHEAAERNVEPDSATDLSTTSPRPTPLWQESPHGGPGPTLCPLEARLTHSPSSPPICPASRNLRRQTQHAVPTAPLGERGRAEGAPGRPTPPAWTPLHTSGSPVHCPSAGAVRGPRSLPLSWAHYSLEEDG